MRSCGRAGRCGSPVTPVVAAGRHLLPAETGRKFLCAPLLQPTRCGGTRCCRRTRGLGAGGEARCARVCIANPTHRAALTLRVVLRAPPVTVGSHPTVLRRVPVWRPRGGVGPADGSSKCTLPASVVWCRHAGDVCSPECGVVHRLTLGGPTTCTGCCLPRSRRQLVQHRLATLRYALWHPTSRVSIATDSP